MEFLNEFDEYEYRAEQRGEKRGKEEKALETAKNLLELGKLSNEEIAKCSGLPIETVKELAKEVCVTAGK